MKTIQSNGLIKPKFRSYYVWIALGISCGVLAVLLHNLSSFFFLLSGAIFCSYGFEDHLGFLKTRADLLGIPTCITCLPQFYGVHRYFGPVNLYEALDYFNLTANDVSYRECKICGEEAITYMGYCGQCLTNYCAEVKRGEMYHDLVKIPLEYNR